ncbi:hypothetical protein ANO11243_000340 [Dothideomycetidae sp. 11243]|nr:hypothetical protein ANO11243_000340 [fungal sp. No.11243]
MSSKYKSKKRVYDSSEDEQQSSKKSKVVSNEAKKDGEGNTYWEPSSSYQVVSMVIDNVQGISLPLEQFTALMTVLPQVVGELSKLGDDVPFPKFETSNLNTQADADASDDNLDKDSPTKSNGASAHKVKHKKGNYESTSDED